ncbi:MAG TPA: hypothetical protein VFZ98_08125 [Vicinamibacterales bacterium]
MYRSAGAAPPNAQPVDALPAIEVLPPARMRTSVSAPMRTSVRAPMRTSVPPPMRTSVPPPMSWFDGAIAIMAFPVIITAGMMLAPLAWMWAGRHSSHG